MVAAPSIRANAAHWTRRDLYERFILRRKTWGETRNMTFLAFPASDLAKRKKHEAWADSSSTPKSWFHVVELLDRDAAKERVRKIAHRLSGSLVARPSSLAIIQNRTCNRVCLDWYPFM